jgi:hypothetical protein
MEQFLHLRLAGHFIFPQILAYDMMVSQDQHHSGLAAF